MISLEDHKKWGCRGCGYRAGASWMCQGPFVSWQCGECRFVDVVYKGPTPIPQKLIQEYSGSWGNQKIEVEKHPREGTPAHGNADNPPPEGEFFASRGLGKDWCPGCFVCGRDKAHPIQASSENILLENIAAFVQCKEAGERVVEMFGKGARLDFREYEPDRVQVKIGACWAHIPNLLFLHERTRESKVLTSALLEAAREFSPH